MSGPALSCRMDFTLISVMPVMPVMPVMHRTVDLQCSVVQCQCVPVQYGLHLLSDCRSQQNASAGLGASIDEGKRKKTSKLRCCNAIRVVTRWSRAFVFRVEAP